MTASMADHWVPRTIENMERSRWLGPHAEQVLGDIHGDHARLWAANLDETLAELCRNWKIDLVARLDGGALSAVATAARHGDSEATLVIKSAPLAARACEQADVYAAWEKTAADLGRPCPGPRVEAVDEARGAILIELISPAAPVDCPSATTDDELDKVAALLEVFAATPAARDQDATRFDSVFGRSHDRLTTWHYDNTDWNVDGWLNASLSAHRLVATDPANRDSLIHGDLWSNNVLDGPHWRAIDPFARAGTVASDAGFWAATAAWGDELELRCHGLAARLGLDPEIVWAYGALWCVDRLGVMCHHGFNPPRIPRLAAAVEHWAQHRS